MKELTEAQEEFIINNSHPILKKNKETIVDREILLKLLCISFTEERRKQIGNLSSIWIDSNKTIEKALSQVKETIINNSWGNVLKTFHVSEEILDEFIEDIPWSILLVEQLLSEKFLRSFKSKIIWNLVAQYQILSESFLEDFSDQINWNTALVYQNHSFEFFLKHKEKLKTINGTLINGSLITGAILNAGDILNAAGTTITMPYINGRYYGIDTVRGTGEIAPNIDFTNRTGVYDHTVQYDTIGYNSTTTAVGYLSTDMVSYTGTSADMQFTVGSGDDTQFTLTNCKVANVSDVENKVIKKEKKKNTNLLSLFNMTSKEQVENFAKSIGFLK